MSIASKLQDIIDIKNAIKTAISNKGVSMTGTTFSDYATKIGAIKTPAGNAGAGQVLTGYTFSNASSVGVSGTMANNGNVSKSVGVGGSYTIPAGYHGGSGKVTGPTLSGDAGVSNVLTGKTFYSNSGTKQTGTMVNNGAVSKTITPTTSTQTYTIPAGYHNGSGKVTVGATSGGGSKVVTSTALACRNNNTYDPCYLFIGSTCPIVPSKIVLNVTQQNANASKSITWTFKLQGRRTGTATFDVLYTENTTITAGATKTFNNTVNLTTTTEYDAFRVYVYDGVRTSFYSNYITVTGTITI